jgi:GMP synthase (glutamine-hydrolysing)
MKSVLIVRAGSAPESVRARHGDFKEWFAAALLPRAEVAFADAEAGSFPQGRRGGIVVTGSVDSVTRPAPWMDALGAWLVETARTTPVLGVCFGHQVLARALGARVERHPGGPEAGTTVVELTAEGRADPLFATLPSRVRVQQGHEDHVPELPPGAVLLATNAHTPVQAFAHGPHIRAVQFHPEFTAERNRAFVEAEREALEASRPGLADAALRSIVETPEASRLLANWVNAYVKG